MRTTPNHPQTCPFLTGAGGWLCRFTGLLYERRYVVGSPDLPEGSWIDCPFSHPSTLPRGPVPFLMITQYHNSADKFSLLFGNSFQLGHTPCTDGSLETMSLPEVSEACWENTNEAPSSPFFRMVHFWKGLGSQKPNHACGMGGKETGGRYMSNLVWRLF